MSDIVERLRNSASGLCSEDPHKYMARGITAGDCLEAAETILALRKEVEAMRGLLAKSSAMQIGPSNEGHRIGIYFDDHNEGSKLFAALSDLAALATEQTP